MTLFAECAADQTDHFADAFGWNKEKICKNNDHTCSSNCNNTCRVPREMFEHSVYRPRVQTPFSGSGKC